MLAAITSLVIMSGSAAAAGPAKQQFYVDFSSQITTELLSGNIKNTFKQKRVVFQDCTPLCVPFDLEKFWREQTYLNDIEGTACFPTSDSKGVVHLGGAIHVLETKSGEARVNIWFDSVYTPTLDTVRYLLILSAPRWTDLAGDTQADFPPTEIDGNFAYMLSTGWELQTEGKGKLRKASCKGSGGWDKGDGVLLMVQRVDLADP
jgi:hypothetical protein